MSLDDRTEEPLLALQSGSAGLRLQLHLATFSTGALKPLAQDSRAIGAARHPDPAAELYWELLELLLGWGSWVSLCF